LDLLREWSSPNSTALDNVSQIGVEMHDYRDRFDSHGAEGYLNVLEAVRALHRDRGFRMVSYEPNRCTDVRYDWEENRYHNFFDVVFKRVTQKH
jgi:hypothetical protein